MKNFKDILSEAEGILPPVQADDFDIYDDDELLDMLLDFVMDLDPDKLSDDMVVRLSDIMDIIYAYDENEIPEDDEISVIENEEADDVDEVDDEISEALAPKRKRINRIARRQRQKNYRRNKTKLKLKAKLYRRSPQGKKMARKAKRMSKLGKTATGKRKNKFVK